MAQLTSPDQLPAAHMPLSQPFPRVYSLYACKLQRRQKLQRQKKQSKSRQPSASDGTVSQVIPPKEVPLPPPPPPPSHGGGRRRGGAGDGGRDRESPPRPRPLLQEAGRVSASSSPLFPSSDWFVVPRESTPSRVFGWAARGASCSRRVLTTGLGKPRGSISVCRFVFSCSGTERVLVIWIQLSLCNGDG